MLSYDSTTETKIDQLRTISDNFSGQIEVYELVKIDWLSGAVYYATTQVDEVSPELPVSPVETRLISDDELEHFLPIVTDSALSDEEIDLKLWDADGVISDLVQESGEGVKVEVFLWFPVVDLLLSVWEGHLRTADGADSEFWTGKASNGFRSPQLPMPSRAHYQECQAIFGGLLQTQAEIDHGGCPYNRHLGGGTGNLNGSVPFTSCPRKTFGDCSIRLGDHLSHLSHQSVTEQLLNGNNLKGYTRGNETNLKRPVRVVMGVRYLRELDLLASAPQFNDKNADKGFWKLMYELCEGPIAQVINSFVGGQHNQNPSNVIHYNGRLGELRQAPSSFSANVHNYSGTAHFLYTYGWTNPSTVAADSIKGEAHVEGLRDIKQWTDPNNYYTGSCRNRAWHLLRMLTDKRWGYGLDESRINIQTFIDSATWGNQLVDFVDPDSGQILRHVRAQSDVELTERTTQQHVEDMCWSGRFSRPFLYQGKMCVVPLAALSPDELEACDEFTDVGDNPNIIVDSETGKTSLTRSQISDSELPNRVELTYDDGTRLDAEATIAVEDVGQQLKAGRSWGDTTRRKIVKKEKAMGIETAGQIQKLAWSILDLGMFDEGGLQNNLEIKFTAWFMDCLKIYPYKVIRVVSNQIARYGFSYFRIKKIERKNNLQVEITAQAYNVDYMNSFETTYVGAPQVYIPAPPNEIAPLEFGYLQQRDQYLEIEIQQPNIF